MEGASELSHLLLALAAVMAAGRLVGRLFRHLGQPPVIGEVVAGILLGPSLLGAVWPAGYAFLLPPAILPALSAIAQLGVILYMFTVGLELDPSALAGRVRSTALIACASIAVPFVLGVLFVLAAARDFTPPGVPQLHFTLFFGVALSVTAFPVLARILADLGMTRTPLGVLALATAAINDVAAWILLAIVVGIAHAGATTTTLLAALGGGAVVLCVAAARHLALQADAAPSRLVMMLIVVLGAAWGAEAAGIHAIFGAFLAGVVVPHASDAARDLRRHVEPLVSALLLSAFFAVAGLSTEIGLVSGAREWMVLGAVVLVASVGKIGGATLASRVAGLSWRDAASLGALMNTRGLMELVVLAVGLELGIVTPTVFTILVLMALATTMATTPVLRWLQPKQ